MLVGVSALAAILVAAAAPPGPPPMYDAAKYATHVADVPNGARLRVAAPDAALDVLHVYGTHAERGRAQGQLLWKEVMWMANHAMPAFFARQPAAAIAALLVEVKAPPSLIIKAELLVRKNASAAWGLALDWVDAQQRPHNDEALYTEMEALADGACDGCPMCSADDAKRAALRKEIVGLNALPVSVRSTFS